MRIEKLFYSSVSLILCFILGMHDNGMRMYFEVVFYLAYSALYTCIYSCLFLSLCELR